MNWTICTAGEAIRTGTLTPSALLEECLHVIAERESTVRAWVVVDADSARREAAKLTAQYRAGYRSRSPLFGLPVGIKDIFDVAGLPTACGAPRWQDRIAAEDSAIVAQFRQAEAVILGKLVTTPYALFDPPITRNPLNLAHTPGGSSAGSAAAVAAGMCLAAVGSQTGGSTIRPASYCGITALKPTYGALSLDGCFPLAPTLDHVGLFARDADSLRALFHGLTALAQPLPPLPKARPKLLDLGGFFRSAAQPSYRRGVDSALEKLRIAGLQVEPVEPPHDFAEVSVMQRRLMAVEAAWVHERDLTAFPDEYPPKFTQLVREGLACRAVDYFAACRYRDHLREEFAELLVEHSDGSPTIFLTPSAPAVAPTIETTGDPIFNSPWSLLGWPTLTIPYGVADHNLPVGLQLSALPEHDSVLLDAAVQIARLLGV